MLAAVLIFAGTYLVLAVGRIPFLRVDRTGAAIVGASLMLAFNVLTVEEAYAAINYDTIMLLFGMMIVVANLRLSGFFAVVSAWVVDHAHAPLVLLSGIVLVSGVFSAFFVNDTMCLVLTPLVLDITRRLGRNPMPYLLAVAMASNIGQRGHHHGQSAEHDDRQLLAHPLPRVRRRAGARWRPSDSCSRSP